MSAAPTRGWAAMKYWLTTHWPPRTDDPNPSQHHGVWLLRCMKYRAMLGYLFKRHPSEVRAMLVAHSIHDDVTSWSVYEIECRTRPRRPT